MINANEDVKFSSFSNSEQINEHKSRMSETSVTGKRNWRCLTSYTCYRECRHVQCCLPRSKWMPFGSSRLQTGSTDGVECLHLSPLSYPSGKGASPDLQERGFDLHGHTSFPRSSETERRKRMASTSWPIPSQHNLAHGVFIPQTSTL